ncbi:hypothetical protein C1645_825648 [Glomus cerebriforme]|uniref:PH domain-containing protein n=1 Tax=Glomus cerebriforme TaxID=658196 RepID=A0A397SY05_9GLOM|nr:hypothetical protein C1645_825648 [Glomus cerebriforme]
MLTKHPTKVNVQKDEINIINTITTANNKSTDTDMLTSTIIEERFKAAAKLEGVSTEKLLSRNKKTTIAANNTNVTASVSINNADRLSKESGIGSSVGSSFDERDDEIDHSNNEFFTSSSSQSTTNTSVSIENAKISPRVSQLLDDLDDTMTKLPNDNKKSLGIITEEEESYNNNLNHNFSKLNHSHDYHNNHSFFKKHPQNRITFSDNLDSNSEKTESSTFNDTESSTSGGEPDSPSLLNNSSIPINNSSTIELEKKKSSFKRKNSGRSIFSVLSSGSLRSSSFQRGSLSDPEDSSSNHQRVIVPGSPSKSDRKLGRSGFASLSIRRRSSKPALSLAVSDSRLNINSNNNNNNNNNKMISFGLSTSRPGSPENFENLSKAGKILGLTVSEEKILLDNKITKKSRDIKTTTPDEKPSNSFKSNSSKANKLLGYNDNRPILSKSSKASKILGLDDNEFNKRSPSMYMDKVVSEFRGGSIGVVSPITVASIKKNVIYKGFLTKYTNTNFVLSKSWKRRYFILAKNTLYCFKSSDNTSQLLDQFELTADSVVCVSDTFTGKSWVLQVGKSNQKSWYIQADNVEDMKAWLTELKSTVVKCNHVPEMPSHSYSNLTDKLLHDDDDDDDDYDDDDIDDTLNDNLKIHQRAFSSPSKLVYSPKAVMKSLSSIDDNSIDDNSIDMYSLPPPPRPLMMTSLPPPPRPRSAPSSPSCPPSPTTSLSPPPRQMSPHNHIPADVEELSNNSINDDDFELPRSSSPVETLSPPRARFGNSIQSHQQKSSISSTYSINSLTLSSRNKHRSNSTNSSLSINTSIQKQSSPRQSPISPPINYSPRKSIRNSSTSSHRESIPIMMPSWGLITASPTSTSNSSDNSNSLSPPPRFLPHLSSHNGQQIPYKLFDFYAHLPNPPKPPEGPKPPARNNVQVSSINSDLYLPRKPPPNIPLPQIPPRPTNTLTSASRVAFPISSRNHIISPPTSSHPPPPIPPPRRPSTDGRMGGKGINSTITNLPVPIQNMKQTVLSSQERTMTLPTNLPSCPPSCTILTARSKSPPPSRKNITSMVYSSNPSRFQTMSTHLPSYFTTAPLPPPTRPPNVPLPPVPTRSFSPLSSYTSTSVTKDITDNTQEIIATTTEFPDDDDLDPDYADELAASRIRSQKKKSTNSLSSSDTTYFPAISEAGNNNYSSANQHPTSGLTFVMVEETLGDGELVLDLQDVSEDHPHVIRSKSSRSNIHHDLIRNEVEKVINRKNSFNTTISEDLKNSEEKEKENSRGKEKEKLEDKSVKDYLNLENDDTIINVNKNVNKKGVDKNSISDILFSKVSI